MIRFTVKVADDIRRVLLKIKESPEYGDFVKRLKIVSDGHYYDLTNKENRDFYRAKIRTLNRIHEQTDAILYLLVDRYKSKTKKGFYTKKAIAAYERFIRVLVKSAREILPDFYPYLEKELRTSEIFFRLDRVL